MTPLLIPPNTLVTKHFYFSLLCVHFIVCKHLVLSLDPSFYILPYVLLFSPRCSDICLVLTFSHMFYCSHQLAQTFVLPWHSPICYIVLITLLRHLSSLDILPYVILFSSRCSDICLALTFSHMLYCSHHVAQTFVLPWHSPICSTVLITLLRHLSCLDILPYVLLFSSRCSDICLALTFSHMLYCSHHVAQTFVLPWHSPICSTVLITLLRHLSCLDILPYVILFSSRCSDICLALTFSHMLYCSHHVAQTFVLPWHFPICYIVLTTLLRHLSCFDILQYVLLFSSRCSDICLALTFSHNMFYCSHHAA